MHNCIRILATACLLLPGVLSASGWSTGFAGQFTLRGGHAGSDWDGSGELRLMPEFRQGRSHQFSLHYEAVAVRNGTGLAPQDARRVFDLTHVISRTADRLAWHRLDRLNYQYAADWGTLTVGRSAITWGNGLVFNPMDLFNPFAPTDVERDYKLGDDLVLLTLYPADWNRQMDWQLLLVPRRDPLSGSIEADQSSLALKGHLFAGEREWDFLLARHFDETVLGLGHIGYLGSAVWRLDATLTLAEQRHEFFSAVANVDYSWTWSGINYYGSLELHYNSIGSSDYGQLPRNGPLLERLARGEMHTLGRAYLAPALQIELHPLLNLHLAAITNIEDPSAAFLPRLVWNARQNLEVTLGASLFAGSGGTEFGGISIPAAGIPTPANRAYLWLKAYF